MKENLSYVLTWNSAFIRYASSCLSRLYAFQETFPLNKMFETASYRTSRCFTQLSKKTNCAFKLFNCFLFCLHTCDYWINISLCYGVKGTNEHTDHLMVSTYEHQLRVISAMPLFKYLTPKSCEIKDLSSANHGSPTITSGTFLIDYRLNILHTKMNWETG